VGKVVCRRHGEACKRHCCAGIRRASSNFASGGNLAHFADLTSHHFSAESHDPAAPDDTTAPDDTAAADDAATPAADDHADDEPGNGGRRLLSTGESSRGRSEHEIERSLGSVLSD